MKAALIAIIFLGVVALAIYSYICMLQENQENIKRWVNGRGEMVISVEQKFFLIGPYMVAKNYNIFKVVSDKNIYWFRFFGTFGRTIYQENSNGEYTKLE
jgi:hypothetical protein